MYGFVAADIGFGFSDARLQASTELMSIKFLGTRQTLKAIVKDKCALAVNITLHYLVTWVLFASHDRFDDQALDAASTTRKAAKNKVKFVTTTWLPQFGVGEGVLATVGVLMEVPELPVDECEVEADVTVELGNEDGVASAVEFVDGYDVDVE